MFFLSRQYLPFEAVCFALLMYGFFHFFMVTKTGKSITRWLFCRNNVASVVEDVREAGSAARRVLPQAAADAEEASLVANDLRRAAGEEVVR